MGVVGRGLLFVLAMLAVSNDAKASCIEPSTLVRSTASLIRPFSDEQRKEAPAILGIRGTGWFLSLQSIVTAAHVAEAMRLSPEEWTEIELGEGDTRQVVSARSLRVVGSLAEKMAVLELRASLSGAT